MRLLFIILLIVFHTEIYSQTIQLPIGLNCTSGSTYNGCPTFTNTCNSTNGWTSSHGTPQLAYGKSFSSAIMVAQSSQNEGMFYPFNFIGNQIYDIRVTFGSTGDPTGLYLFASQGLAEHFDGCQGGIPSNSKEFIGSAGSIFSPADFRFTPQNSRSQFWMYPLLNSGIQGTVHVYSIEITPICSTAAPTGLGTTNNGATLIWDAVSGASSYQIIVTDTYNGNVLIQNLESNTNSLNYCPQGTGSSVNFVVYGKCANGATGASSAYNYTYTAPFATVPTGLHVTNITSTSATINWDPQPGSSFYGTYYGGSYGSFGAGSLNSYTLTGLTPNSNYNYTINAFGNCGGVQNSSGTFTTLQACSTPGGVTAQGTSNAIYVYFPTPPSGITNANLKYKVYGNPTEYTINNISASSPYIFSIGTNGTPYQFSIQWICPQSGTVSSYSNWSTPSASYKMMTPTTKPGKNHSNIIEPNTDSLGLNKLTSPGIKIYPNPATNELNIFLPNKSTNKFEIEIIDVLGKVVFKENLENNYKLRGQSHKIKIEELKSGTYFVQIQDGQQVIIEKLIIKK